MKKILFFILLVDMCSLTGCNKEEEKNVLDHSYEGALSFEYSRDFPDFGKDVHVSVSIAKDGSVTFGPGAEGAFQGEDIYYEDGKPVLKLKVTGTIKLISAKGEYHKINNEDYVWIWTNSTIKGTQYVWIWDDDLQDWVAPPAGHEVQFEYADQYSDGQMQFSIQGATVGGESIKATLPDLHGNFTYGYKLDLIMSLI
jgi:hypothetical protein